MIFCKRNLCNLLKDNSGFTLIELAVGLTIMGMLSLVVAGLFTLGSESVNRVYNTAGGRAAMRNAQQVLRSDIQKLSADSLLHTEKDQLTFYDIDGVYVNYRIVDHNLLRNDRTILTGILNKPFEYLNEDLKKAKGGSEVCFVEVELQISPQGHIQQSRNLYYVRN